MRSRAQNGKARKIERKAASLRPSRPGGGKNRADLSIRFEIVGEGEETTKLLGCEGRRRGCEERERSGVKKGESEERETE